MSDVRLGDHAKLIRGITFKPVDKCDPRDEGAVVCMRTKNVQATLDASDLIAVPSPLVKNPEKMLSAGDILVSSANSWNLVGKCCQVPRLHYPSTAGGFISILRPKTEKLESSYLYRWFSSDVVQRKLRSFANQTTNISNLDHKRALELQIPLPPLDEQKRIAGILDAAETLRVKRREALAKLDTLLQSIFLDMFGDPVTNPKGWGVMPLNELLGEKSTAGAYYPKNAYSSVGTRMVHMANAFYGVVNPNEVKRVDAPLADIEKYGLLPTDILVSRRSLNYEGSAKPCLIPETDEPMIFESSLIRVRPDRERVLTIYLFHYLLNSRARAKYVFPLVTRSTISGISQSNLMKVKVVLPPLDLQFRFAVVVESIEQQRARQRAHLAELDTLFTSLQSRAFRGEL